MKIILTGSNGLLGQKLCDAITSDSNNVLYGFSRGEDRYASTKENYHYFDINIADKQTLLAKLNAIKPNLIIHSAAITNVDYCENHVEETEQVNVEATKTLADYCAKDNCHLTFLSTDFIFDGKKGTRYTEKDEAKPLSVYGKSKLLAENYVQSVPGLHYAIARTCLVFGTAKGLSRSNIALWAIGALKKNEPLKIVNDQYRTPTFAEDLADGVLALSMNECQGIYNVSGDEFISIQSLIEMLAKVFGFTLENVQFLSSAELNQPANRPPKTGFDISKIKSAVNYKPHSLQSALEQLRLQLQNNN